MNPPPSSPSGGIHRFARVLSLVLLQHVLAPGHVNAGSHSRLPTGSDGDLIAAVTSYPYLKTAGAQPLRFDVPPPVPRFASKAVEAIGQPTPVAAAASSPPPAGLGTEPVAKPGDSSSSVQTIEPARANPATSTHPSNILPDDTRPTTRAEDFLPFFQFPGGNGVTVVVPATMPSPPAPGQLPVSSATYQQK
jgi:hypothetical protein